MATPRSDFEREMQALETEIRRLETDYNQFLTGRVPRLPWEARQRIEQTIRRMDRNSTQNTAERFRFQSIQSRFVAFCELWERTLKLREGGRAPGPAGRRPPSPPPAQSPTRAETPPPAARVGEGVVAGASLGGGASEASRVRELYDRMSQAREALGQPPVPYGRFEKLIESQIEKLGAGGASVEFRVSVKDGKVNLTAKSTKEP